MSSLQQFVQGGCQGRTDKELVNSYFSQGKQIQCVIVKRRGVGGESTKMQHTHTYSYPLKTCTYVCVHTHTSVTNTPTHPIHINTTVRIHTILIHTNTYVRGLGMAGRGQQ